MKANGGEKFRLKLVIANGHSSIGPFREYYFNISSFFFYIFPSSAFFFFSQYQMPKTFAMWKLEQSWLLMIVTFYIVPEIRSYVS